MYRPPFHYTPPKCPDCGGKGRTEYEGMMPQTCDRCHGQGYYVNPVAVIGCLMIIMLTTFGPFVVLWWIN